MNENSHTLFTKAQSIIPGAVNSPVRACAAVGCEPLFIASAKGSKVISEDNDTYIDFVQSWGPMLLGHAHPAVTKAIQTAAERGTSYGAPCAAEVTLASMVVDALPSVEMTRMVNSGTEATMSALRLARGCTGRNKVIKFEGGYHGHADPFLASAGSGVATLSIPGTPGVPESVVADTLLAPYNDLTAVKRLFEQHKASIAAVIVEPIAGNMGLILPKEGFLEGLRALCTQYDALLIFDEVITGFRASYGGAQQRFQVMPDLTTIGKIIGGGLPVGGFCGRAQFMQRVAPSGDIYQAGTLSGNPLAMAAGIATLQELQRLDYAHLEQQVEEFCCELEAIFAHNKISVTINRIASMFTIFFTDAPVTDFSSAKKSDTERFSRYYRHMRENNIAIAPSGFEAAMVSFAHTKEDFVSMLEATKRFQG